LHWSRNICSSEFASSDCCGTGGVDDDDEEHPASANSPSTAVAKLAAFTVLAAFEPKFLSTIELPPNSFEPYSGISVLKRDSHFHRRQAVCNLKVEPAKKRTGESRNSGSCSAAASFANPVRRK
jgi:hypothetical protein